MCSPLVGRQLRRGLAVGGLFLVLIASGIAPSAVFAQSFRPRPRPTPEIDAGLARSAIAVLIGGVLVLTDRWRRR